MKKEKTGGQKTSIKQEHQHSKKRNSRNQMIRIITPKFKMIRKLFHVKYCMQKSTCLKWT